MQTQKTVVLTVGLPASGKSTYAARLKSICDVVEVNLDDCREKVSGDASDQGCTPEALVEHKRQVAEAVERGQHLVISDTNLNSSFRQELTGVLEAQGYLVIVEAFPTPFIVCQARNIRREKPVPFHAMTRMWQSALDQGIYT